MSVRCCFLPISLLFLVLVVTMPPRRGSRRSQTSHGARSRPYSTRRRGGGGSAQPGASPDQDTGTSQSAVPTSQPTSTEQFLRWIQAAVRQQIDAMASGDTLQLCGDPVPPVTQPQRAHTPTPSPAIATARVAVSLLHLVLNVTVWVLAFRLYSHYRITLLYIYPLIMPSPALPRGL